MAEKKSAAKSRAAAPAKPNEPKNEDEFGDAITSPFGQWWGYIKANFAKFYLKMLAINLIDLVVKILIMVLLLAVVMGGGIAIGSASSELASAGLTGMAIIAVVYLIYLLISNWLHYAIKFLAILFADSEFSKKPFSMWGSFTAIAGRAFRFTIVDGLIRIALLLPVILVAVLVFLNISWPPQGASAILLMAAYFVAILYIFVVFSMYTIVVQFWSYGFLIEGLGVVDSLKKGVSILRKKILETLIFDIAGAMLYLMAMIPLVVVYFVLYFVMMLAMISAAALMPGMGIVMVILWVLVLGIAVVIFTSLAECAWVPTHYLFWKKISGK
ncbi:MAG: hypothetical protein PHF60_03280 [Candidatus ainarchaeum sp.]|nr:hypothetical protein [Candidatus ainarchaeum sp.]